ncbi:hypothetical protein PFDG_04289 [Plasmodium falciparum Dd2]|uniref:Uncharacterized protein n=1 Tax=Plasmodium falciparum (isolate Dd2) TaxID=57267 RepID=A0A0L7M4L0_PLAF4|nr:hypothetical protein PFDG_04289 [Plasmodium falciparum Dd2]
MVINNDDNQKNVLSLRLNNKIYCYHIYNLEPLYQYLMRFYQWKFPVFIVK